MQHKKGALEGQEKWVPAPWCRVTVHGADSPPAGPWGKGRRVSEHWEMGT